MSRVADSTEERGCQVGAGCRAPAPAGTLNYVYLASAEHSGSTLLACLLGAHPAVSCVGEFGTDFPLTGRCSCGVTYAECGFWAAWARAAAERGLELCPGKLGINLKPRQGAGLIEDVYFYQFASPWLARARDLLFSFPGGRSRRAFAAARRSIELARILCEMEQTSTFLDTTKNALQIRFLSQSPGIRLKVIALLRDGRGVMSSLMEKEKATPEEAIGAWLWANKNLERAVKLYTTPETVYWLRLEELCRDPDRIRMELLRFLEVDPAVPLAYPKDERHIVGNKMRHTFTGEIRHDESWRTKLGPEHLALFESRAGAVNRKLGYGS